MRTRIAALLSVIALAISTLVFVGIRSDRPATLNAQLAAAQTYKITGTDIGIMFRSDPNDWESRAGAAGYDGDSVELKCWTTGVAVGPYNNKTWYQATTSRGSGYLPDRFIDTPVVANDPPPGLAKCDAIKNVAPQAPAAKASPKSVFFSGTDVAKGSAAEAVSDLDYKLNDWSSGDTCNGAKIPYLVPNTVDTLAGWSRGRIGVVYFLAYASKEQRDRIHRIVLFDPGNQTDIEGPSFGPLKSGSGGCDYKFNVNKLLADWLKSDSRNKLIVIAGNRTEDKKKPEDPSSKSTFNGMWKYYFAGIWNQKFAGRAQVCDYDTLSHEESLSDFAGIVRHASDSCPAAPDGHPLQAWHP